MRIGLSPAGWGTQWCFVHLLGHVDFCFYSPSSGFAWVCCNCVDLLNVLSVVTDKVRSMGNKEVVCWCDASGVALFFWVVYQSLVDWIGLLVGFSSFGFRFLWVFRLGLGPFGFPVFMNLFWFNLIARFIKKNINKKS